MIGPEALFMLGLAAAFLRSRFPPNTKGAERIAGEAPPKSIGRRKVLAHEPPAVTVCAPKSLAEIRAQMSVAKGQQREALILMEDDCIANSAEYQARQDADYEAWLAGMERNGECDE